MNKCSLILFIILNYQRDLNDSLSIIMDYVPSPISVFSFSTLTSPLPQITYTLTTHIYENYIYVVKEAVQNCDIEIYFDVHKDMFKISTVTLQSLKSKTTDTSGSANRKKNETINFAAFCKQNIYWNQKVNKQIHIRSICLLYHYEPIKLLFTEIL